MSDYLSKACSRCSGILVATATGSDLANQSLVDGRVAHCFHHCQMLEVIVRLEQSITSEELDQNAANAPNVTGKTPSEVENNLGSTVVAGRDNRGVILVVKSG